MIDRPHKPDRDIRRDEIALARQRKARRSGETFEGWECAADREPAARETRIRRLIKRIGPVLSRLSGAQRPASAATKHQISSAQRARLSDGAGGDASRVGIEE